MSVAERSLDVQYYVWHKDMTGTLLFNGLHKAADRGVRVRLLLDDGNTSGSTPSSPRSTLIPISRFGCSTLLLSGTCDCLIFSTSRA